MMNRKTLTLLLVAILSVVLPVWGEEAKPTAQSIDIGKTTCKDLMAGGVHGSTRAQKQRQSNYQYYYDACMRGER
jgi:hypothetical protein